MNDPMFDEHGSSMLLELILIATILAFVGLALFQSNNQVNTAALQQKLPVVSVEQAAEATTKTLEQSAADELVLSAEAEAAADDAAGMMSEVSDLEGGADASTF